MKERHKVTNGAAQIWLSIVVIGRDESRWLPGLFRSLPAAPDTEWLYIDSRSTDSSAAIALKSGARVFSLHDHRSLCPASGRYTGTLLARGKWILYLDGDMLLCEEFAAFLADLRAGEATLPGAAAGFVGKTRSIFLSETGEQLYTRDDVCLTARPRGHDRIWGSPADYHGGAVLYRRQVVLDAGNWNPAVSQLEEIDLYSRVRGLGYRVFALEKPMADHFTPRHSLKRKMQILFMPWMGEKKYHGAGQLLVSRLKARSLSNLVRYYPGPFIVFGGLAAALPCFLLWKPLPLLLNGAIALYFGLRKRWYFYLVHLGTIIQALCGLRSYSPFKPHYTPVSANGQAEARDKA